MADATPAPTTSPDPPAAPTTPAPGPGLVGRLKGWIGRRNDRTQARWNELVATHGHHFERRWLLFKVVLVHARYTCGYLATAFLVSTPYQLIVQVIRARRAAETGAADPSLGPILHSLVVGLVLLAVMGMLVPVTRIDWSKMRLPEFKVFELNLSWWALMVSAAYLLLSLIADPVWGEHSLVGEVSDRRVALPVVTLMAFSWVRAKFDAWLFRDFYTLGPDDDSLVLFKSVPPPSRPPSAATPPAATPPAATPPPESVPPST